MSEQKLTWADKFSATSEVAKFIFYYYDQDDSDLEQPREWTFEVPGGMLEACGGFEGAQKQAADAFGTFLARNNKRKPKTDDFDASRLVAASERIAELEKRIAYLESEIERGRENNADPANRSMRVAEAWFGKKGREVSDLTAELERLRSGELPAVKARPGVVESWYGFPPLSEDDMVCLDGWDSHLQVKSWQETKIQHGQLVRQELLCEVLVFPDEHDPDDKILTPQEIMDGKMNAYFHYVMPDDNRNAEKGVEVRRFEMMVTEQTQDMTPWPVYTIKGKITRVEKVLVPAGTALELQSRCKVEWEENWETLPNGDQHFAGKSPPDEWPLHIGAGTFNSFQTAVANWRAASNQFMTNMKTDPEVMKSLQSLAQYGAITANEAAKLTGQPFYDPVAANKARLGFNKLKSPDQYLREQAIIKRQAQTIRNQHWDLGFTPDSFDNWHRRLANYTNPPMEDITMEAKHKQAREQYFGSEEL